MSYDIACECNLIVERNRYEEKNLKDALNTFRKVCLFYKATKDENDLDIVAYLFKEGRIIRKTII